jgi:hypothetical protein
LHIKLLNKRKSLRRKLKRRLLLQKTILRTKRIKVTPTDIKIDVFLDEEENSSTPPSPSLSSSGYNVPTGPPAQTAIFGVPIADAIAKSAKINEDIPDIVTKCVLYLQERGKIYIEFVYFSPQHAGNIFEFVHFFPQHARNIFLLFI